MSKRRFEDYGPGEEYGGGGNSGGRFGESRFGGSGERESRFERKRWDQGSNDHDRRGGQYGSGKGDYSRIPPPPPPPPPPTYRSISQDSNGKYFYFFLNFSLQFLSFVLFFRVRRKSS